MRYGFLDGLRGVAIAGVVLTHAGQVVRGLSPHLSVFSLWGLRGVQLFFMVSSLTLCLVYYEKSIDRTFFFRRFFRIAPMFYMAGLFYFILNRVGFTNTSILNTMAIDGIMTMLFIHGLNPHSINNIVPGGWSIADEALFYASFPVIVRYVRSTRAAVALVTGAIALWVINYAAGKVLESHLSQPMWGQFFHFNIFSAAPAFAFGVLIFHLFRRANPSDRQRRICNLGVYAVAGLVIAYGVVSSSIPAAELPYSFLLAALVLLVALSHNRVFISPSLRFLGEISFSLYLVHFAIVALVKSVLPPPRGAEGLFLFYVEIMVVAIPISWVLNRVVERPMVSFGKRVAEPARAAVAG